MEITWKKIGSGSFRLHGKIIKPGQTFKAREEEIPQAFRDVVIPTDPIQVAKGKEEEFIKNHRKITFKKVESERPGRFDVINEVNGKKMNDNPLKEDKADALIADLNDVTD